MNLLLVAGTRPNFMKVAPLIKAVDFYNSAAPNSDSKVNCSLVHTGQHYDEKMSDVFFRELGIPQPDINLGIGSGSHAVQTANIMVRFESVLLAQKPDWLVVVGDVNSTMACTLVAAKIGVKVAHVEAGLRSFDRTMPEEINRLVTDALASLLLTPSEDANENLRREGVSEEKIKLVGNIMIDSLVANLAQARQSQIMQRCQIEPGRFVYVTLHRPSNVDQKDNLTMILTELDHLARQLPVVFSMHPRTRKMLGEFGLATNADGAIKIIEPVGYHDSLCLTEHARLVLTDSGGLQEESTYFRTPCLTLRPNTERPVTITVGSNRLTSPHRLRADLAAVMKNGTHQGNLPPLWDGKTAERIVHCLVSTNS
jgi:UDP-N-acetylglucosamine 2-epimerase (non-hydrolysing)